MSGARPREAAKGIGLGRVPPPPPEKAVPRTIFLTVYREIGVTTNEKHAAFDYDFPVGQKVFESRN